MVTLMLIVLAVEFVTAAGVLVYAHVHAVRKHREFERKAARITKEAERQMSIKLVH